MQLGASNVKASYVPLNQARQGANAYVEYRFQAAAGSLNSLSNSGPIQNGFIKQDYSAFNQEDDYSYVLNRDYLLNGHITAYINGSLLYGTEPVTGLRVGAEGVSGQLSVRVLGNPVTSDQVEVEISGVEGQAVSLELVDLQGHRQTQQRIDQARSKERILIPFDSQNTMLLNVQSGSQQQTVRIIKAK